MPFRLNANDIKKIAIEIANSNNAKLITKKFYENRNQKVAYNCKRGHIVEKSLSKFRFTRVFCNKCRLEIQKEPLITNLQKSEVPLWHW